MEMDKEPVIIVNRADYSDNDLKKYCHDEKLEIIAEIPDDRKIAECYSVGNLAVLEFPEYYKLFQDTALKILSPANNKKNVLKKIKKEELESTDILNVECAVKENKIINETKEVVIISGKGGTGKTSITAAFCTLEKNIAISDCDVDAADLHLVLNPKILQSGGFSGGKKAEIEIAKCTSCGKCYNVCKFNAVIKNSQDNKNIFFIDPHSCEGCGACLLVCKSDAINLKPVINGKWFISQTRFGPMSHAKLGTAEENSGKLVSLIRNKENQLAKEFNINLSIIDGSPGTGCPVIASITGCDYAVVVTEPTVSGVHDLKRILDVIKFFNIKSGIIINKYDLNIEKTREIKKITADCKADFLGTIPYDKLFTEAQMKKKSIIEYTDNNTTITLKEIWNNIKQYIIYKTGKN